MTNAAAHLLAGVSVAWVLATTLVVILYAFGIRFDDE